MLKAVLDAGIFPGALVGTSIGSVNAAFLAADPTPAQAQALCEIWGRVRARDFFRLSPLAIGEALVRRGSQFAADRWRRLLEDALPYGLRVERLADWGVEVVFGLPGDGINGIMEGLRCHHRRGRGSGTGRLRVVVAGALPGPVHEGAHVFSSVPGDELVGQAAQVLLGESLRLQLRAGVIGQEAGALDLRRLGLDVARSGIVGSLLVLQRPRCVPSHGYPTWEPGRGAQ